MLAVALRREPRPRPPPPQFPRLLLPHDPCSDYRAFFDASTGGVLFLREPVGKTTVCGSSFGWLALIDAAKSDLSLLNPFTRGTIDLPRSSSLPSYNLGFRVSGCCKHSSNGEIINERIQDDHNSSVDHGRILKGYPWKASLSSCPGDEEYVVVLILAESEEFAHCRIGDEKWTSPFVSAVFHERIFYAFDREAAGVALDPVSGQCVSIPYPKFGYTFMIKQLYVVRRDSELLMVLYYCRFDDFVDFEDEEEVEEIKVRIETIGDSALYL